MKYLNTYDVLRQEHMRVVLWIVGEIEALKLLKIVFAFFQLYIVHGNLTRNYSIEV